MEGINVITYQTALNAFDKKYLEGTNKIVNDPGEGSKPTALLQIELEKAIQDLKKATQIAHGK